MTDSFVQNGDDKNTNTNTNTSFQGADKATAGDTGVDTKSTEYQLQMLQKRLEDKDEFINTLKEENKETRNMYATLEERMKNMEEISEVLKGKEQDVSSQVTSLDENALVGKVIDSLNKKEQEALYQNNFDNVLSRLTEEFGSAHIEDKVAEAARANGLSVNDMKETARKSPTAFYNLVGLKNKDNRSFTPSPTHGTTTPPPESGQKDLEYYSTMLRTNPKEYWKPANQREYRKLILENIK